MKTTPFGNTEREVSVIGLGGEGILRTFGREKEAQAVIKEALNQGITYFDSARVYSDSELYYGSVWRQEPSVRQSIFQTSKSASRDKNGALADLTATLKRLQTDYLDLWQIHDIRTKEDFLDISGPGGALEAFVEAKEKGMIRYIGITGHHDPHILTKAVEEWPVDSVLFPVNPIEEIIGGFLTHTLPAAHTKGIATIGMKLLGGSHYIYPKIGISPELLIRYSFSFDISLSVIGCSRAEEVQLLATLAKKKIPLSESEKQQLEDTFRPYAAQLAFYRGVK